ncbi:serine/threonine-protein kinase MARK2 [Planoprotostelium fungivorum]|uniref:non-specific serine/threonine protein kinase n=1 Tax=Planoprotostelium fungivorum TaxID=1890364 RepID=A0A2P6N590_9EUKA|nr:serine/threonine-protein kinase MARK2 [Planoprotostelium fungivorum]
MSNPNNGSPRPNQGASYTRTVKHFECRKGVTRVTSLQSKEVDNGKKLGILPCSVSMMLGEKHLELTVILDTKGISRSNNGSRWFGFYFCGTVSSLEKCFQKKYHNLRNIFSLVDNGLSKPSGDAYSSSLLVIGDMAQSSDSPSTTNQAFWQGLLTNVQVVGFIPLFHRTDVFHTIPEYPLRNPTAEDSHGAILCVCTNLDRNHLLQDRNFPANLELDQMYSSTLAQASSVLKPEKWKIQVCENTNSTGDILGCSYDIMKKNYDNLLFLENVTLCKKKLVKEVDLIGVSINPSGRTHISLALEGFHIDVKDAADNPSAYYKKRTESLLNDIETLGLICAKGVTIYNPFLARESAITPTVITSSEDIRRSSTVKTRTTSSRTASKSLSSTQNDDTNVERLLEEVSLLNNSPPAASSVNTPKAGSTVALQDPSIVKTGSVLPVEPQELQWAKTLNLQSLSQALVSSFTFFICSAFVAARVCVTERATDPQSEPFAAGKLLSCRNSDEIPRTCGFQYQVRGKGREGFRTLSLITGTQHDARTNEIDETMDALQKTESEMGIKMIGDYQIGETIGEGSFSKVKLGVHKNTGEKVALKTIGLERFRREIQIHQKLNHPNIVKLMEVIEKDECTCLVVEYVLGSDLLDVVMGCQQGKLSEPVAMKYFSDIVRGVRHLHENGFVHRDLKLENIMVGTNGVCKLIDFGLASDWSPEKCLKTPCGSAIYAAPEILLRKDYTGPKADVWALGVLLYSMISGAVPWPGDNTHQQLSFAIRGQWTTLPSASVSVQNLLIGCLHVDIDNRMGILDVSEHRWLNPTKKASKKKFGLPLVMW